MFDNIGRKVKILAWCSLIACAAAGTIAAIALWFSGMPFLTGLSVLIGSLISAAVSGLCIYAWGRTAEQAEKIDDLNRMLKNQNKDISHLKKQLETVTALLIDPETTKKQLQEATERAAIRTKAPGAVKRDESKAAQKAEDKAQPTAVPSAAAAEKTAEPAEQMDELFGEQEWTLDTLTQKKADLISEWNMISKKITELKA